MRRVAIEYIGLVRGFRYESVRNSIYERIVKSLENQGYAVDFFWHTYDVQFDDVIYSLDKNQFNVIDLVVDSDEEMENYLINEYCMMDKYTFSDAWQNRSRGMGKSNLGIDYSVPDHYLCSGWGKRTYSLKKVTEMRNKYENKNSIHYDWVISTAPQFEPLNVLDDITGLSKDCMYSPSYAFGGGFYTGFFFGTPEQMNYVATIYDRFINQTLGTNYLVCEPVFAKLVAEKYIMKRILDIRFNRIRYDGSRKLQ